MILIVDADERARARTAERLEDAGFEVSEASTLDAARTRLDAERTVDCLVTEYSLPDGTGLELIQTARELEPDASCILFTAVPLSDIDTASFGDTIAEYLSRDDPEADEELVSLVEYSLAFQSQTSYPLPTDEDARLAALEQYTANTRELESALDRLTEIATSLFDVEASAIGLIDAHQEEFLSCTGVTLDSLDREETICTYAILDEDVTVIEDVQDDPRFSENEGLEAVGIRFYASAPLVTPDDRPIGTFCIYDGDARALSDRERHLLQLLAAEAMDQLELRRRLSGTEGEADA